MSWFARIFNYFSVKNKARTVGENESFVNLLRAAQEDSLFREELIAVLRRPEPQRVKLLDKMIRRMNEDGVDESIIQAVSSLEDTAVAARVIELLKKSD
jgi:hypothetical protein